MIFYKGYQIQIKLLSQLKPFFQLTQTIFLHQFCKNVLWSLFKKLIYQQKNENFDLDTQQISIEKNPEEQIQKYIRLKFNNKQMVFEGRELSRKNESLEDRESTNSDKIENYRNSFKNQFNQYMTYPDFMIDIIIRLKLKNKLLCKADILKHHDCFKDSLDQNSCEVPLKIRDEQLEPQSVFITGSEDKKFDIRRILKIYPKNNSYKKKMLSNSSKMQNDYINNKRKVLNTNQIEKKNPLSSTIYDEICSKSQRFCQICLFNQDPQKQKRNNLFSEFHSKLLENTYKDIKLEMSPDTIEVIYLEFDNK